MTTESAPPRVSDCGSGPGPVWWWGLAWSVQGIGMLWFEPLATGQDYRRFAAMSVLAALPLAALYLTLARRARAGGGRR